MKTEVKEVNISVNRAGKLYENFKAQIRDGELIAFDNLREGTRLPTKEEIEAYIQFCKEVVVESEG